MENYRKQFKDQGQMHNFNFITKKHIFITCMKHSLMLNTFKTPFMLPLFVVLPKKQQKDLTEEWEKLHNEFHVMAFEWCFLELSADVQYLHKKT